MTQLDNILVFLGGVDEEPMVEAAARLARGNQGAVRLLDVVSQTSPGPIGLPGVAEAGEALDLLVESRHRVLEGLAGRLRDQGMTVEIEVRVGSPFIEIIRSVLRNNIELVMMGAGRQPRSRENPFGSTVLHVLRKCPCPVWVIKPRAGNRPRRVMAAVDLEPSDPAGMKMNRQIMGLAYSIAQLEHGRLDVVHVRERSALSGGASARVWEQWRRLASSQLTKRLKALVAGYATDGVEIETRLVEGAPAAAIVRFANDNGVDLVVMGTLCRTGIAGLFIGNTAEDILKEIRCSVLAVKPEGFVSPVDVPGGEQ